MSQTFVPDLAYRDAKAALRWLEQAFGFETTLLVTDDEGRVGHATMSFGGGTICVGEERAGPDFMGPAMLRSPASLRRAGSSKINVILSEGIDDHCARARAAGARITQAPANQSYGDRTYLALDLEGHVWMFFQKIADVSPTEMAKAGGVNVRERL